MTTATRTEPSAATMERTSAPRLVTYRIENCATGRVLLNGFHTEIQFTSTPETSEGIAEFGSRASAEAVLVALDYSVHLEVVEREWPWLDDVATSKLSRRVADTGASANLLFWNPRRRLARALSGFGGRR